jgi:hypothetical protein
MVQSETGKAGNDWWVWVPTLAQEFLGKVNWRSVRTGVRIMGDYVPIGEFMGTAQNRWNAEKGAAPFTTRPTQTEEAWIRGMLERLAEDGEPMRRGSLAKMILRYAVCHTSELLEWASSNPLSKHQKAAVVALDARSGGRRRRQAKAVRSVITLADF